MRIGVAGLGRMGAAMAERLIAVGHEVHVWNRTPAKVKPLVELGAKEAVAASDLTQRCEAVITMLTNARSLADVYEGPTGLIAGDAKGKLFIEMSTVQPHDEEALAAKVKAKGARFVECPVGGTVGPAKSGQLLGVAGADNGGNQTDIGNEAAGKDPGGLGVLKCRQLGFKLSQLFVVAGNQTGGAGADTPTVNRLLRSGGQAGVGGKT